MFTELGLNGTNHHSGHTMFKLLQAELQLHGAEEKCVAL